MKILLSAIFAFFCLAIFQATWADTNSSEQKETCQNATAENTDIIIKHDIYENKKYEPMLFSHRVHSDFKCGACHHNEKGEPLDDLKFTDQVQACQDCHSNPGVYRAAEGGNKLDYHQNAMHDNCRTCHKEHGLKTTCMECHTRPEKK